jgi:hypothetical protein
MSRRRQVALTMGVGFALMAAVLVWLLLQTPKAVISSNYVTVTQELGLLREHTTVCQSGERLPAGTAAIRVSMGAIAHVGPSVSATVSHQGRIVASGHHDGGWVSGSLTVPLRPPVEKPADAKICLVPGRIGMPVELIGNMAPRNLATTVNGTPLSGRMRVEYLTRGHRSWLSMARHVARRLGLGHSPSGAWIVFPLVVLMALAVTLAAWLLLREQRYE